MEIFCYDSRHYIKNIRLAMDKFDVAQNNEEVSKARQEVVDSVKELESNNDLHILLSLKTCLKDTEYKSILEDKVVKWEAKS